MEFNPSLSKLYGTSNQLKWQIADPQTKLQHNKINRYQTENKFIWK